MTTIGGNNEFSGIDAFKAVGDSLYYKASGEDTEGRLYIQLKTHRGITKAYSTSDRSQAASFSALTNYVENLLNHEKLSSSDKRALLTTLSYEKEGVTLSFWDKTFNSSKKVAVDKANTLEEKNKGLFNPNTFSVDELGDSVFPPDEH